MGQCFGATQAQPSNATGAPTGAPNAAGIHQAPGNNPPQISLHTIQQVTNRFLERIGEGESARVYRGKINHQLVAVKRLNFADARRNEEYKREVGTLTHLRHPNIINLLGVCFESIELIVVYEYMPSRSLHDWLHDRQAGEGALDWETRMMIGAGVAKGLSHLHNEAEPRVIFGDLKPADVLLGEGYHPKISDFGAAIKIPPQSQNSIVQINRADHRMTHPYWAPEAVAQGALSPRSDVYSFGVLLLEIIIRTLPRNKNLKCFVDDRVRDPANFVRLADSELNGQFDDGELIKAMGLASLCMQRDPDARPAMSDVVRGMNNLAGEPGAVWPEEFNVAAAAAE